MSSNEARHKKIEIMTTYTNRLNEFKALNAKRNIAKGYMQGLTLEQYNRLNSLHAYLMSSEEGKLEVKKA
jgi:mevalonate pyrophosphate decarboxylase